MAAIPAANGNLSYRSRSNAESQPNLSKLKGFE